MSKEYKLEWYDDATDSLGNTYWEAEAKHCSCPYFYRICQKLANDKILFYDDSDVELQQGYKEWETLEEAKKDFDKRINSFNSFENFKMTYPENVKFEYNEFLASDEEPYGVTIKEHSFHGDSFVQCFEKIADELSRYNTLKNYLKSL